MKFDEFGILNKEFSGHYNMGVKIKDLDENELNNLNLIKMNSMS